MSINKSFEDKKPRFAVVIPLYNKRSYISNCIESVLQQRFKDFELLVVDDASSDGSIEIVRSFNDSRIKILSRAEPGTGGYAARNHGVMHARAEWITFLDADDYWLPHHLEEVKAAILMYPNVSMFSTGFEKVGKKIERICASFSQKLTATAAMARLSGKDIFHVNAVTVKRAVYLESGGFIEDRDWNRGGDSELWPRLLATSREVVLIPEVTAIWDIRNSDITVKNFEGAFLHPALISFNERNIPRVDPSFLRSQHIFAIRACCGDSDSGFPRGLICDSLTA